MRQREHNMQVIAIQAPIDQPVSPLLAILRIASWAVTTLARSQLYRQATALFALHRHRAESSGATALDQIHGAIHFRQVGRNRVGDSQLGGDRLGRE